MFYVYMDRRFAFSKEEEDWLRKCLIILTNAVNYTFRAEV